MQQNNQNIRAFELCRVVGHQTIGMRLELPFAFELVKAVVLQIEFIKAIFQIFQIVQIFQTIVIAILVKVEFQIVVFKLVL